MDYNTSLRPYNAKYINSPLSFHKHLKNPRIFSSHCTYSNSRPKLFSLLDINDKITNSRGTSIPIQFKRLSDDENQRQFGFSYRTDKKYDFSMIRKILSANKTSKKLSLIINNTNNNIVKNKTSSNTNNNVINNNTTKNKKYKKIEIKLEENKIETPKNSSAKTKKILSRSKTEIISDNLKIKNRNDRWLPKGYPEYELLVKNPKLLAKKIKDDPFAGKLPEYTLKEIRHKSDTTDIFFLNEPSEKEFLSKNFQPKKKNDNQNSDIFNLKNDDFNLLKCSETFLFKKQAEGMYSITRESNSKWNPKPCLPTFINCSSKEYNILIPNKKNMAPTKAKIIIECDKRKKECKNKDGSKAIETVNLMNPFYRQKGLGEFIDITRNGGNNPGKDFINCYEKNNRCFTKRNGVCSTFNDSYVFYKDICNRPFIVDPSFKIK